MSEFIKGTYNSTTFYLISTTSTVIFFNEFNSSNSLSVFCLISLIDLAVVNGTFYSPSSVWESDSADLLGS